MKLRRLKNNRGFTLIELMIVVIIIGILTSLATIGYSMYMNRARVSRLRAYVVSLGAKQMDAMSRQVVVPFSVGSYKGHEKAYKNILGFNESVYPDVSIDTEAWTASGSCQRCATYGIPAPAANQAGFYAVAQQDMKPGGDKTTVYMTNNTPAPIEVHVGE